MIVGQIDQNVSNNYSAWLFWRVTMRCNLNCVYCYIDGSLRKNEELHPIDIPRLIQTLDATNRIFKVGFGGGEPFLVPNIVEACAEITKKHYIGFVTNLTCDNVREFAEKIDPRRVYRIAMSIQVKELERHNLVEKAINNFLLCQRKGFSIRARIVAYPPLAGEAEKYRIFFKKNGIDIKFRLFFGKYNNKLYPKSYTDEEIAAFGFSREEINKFYRYQGICNAGYNAVIAEPNGDIYPCDRSKPEIMGNLYKKIKFNKYLMVCPVIKRYCRCPLKEQDPCLFQRALGENSSVFKRIPPLLLCFLKVGRNFPRRLKRALFAIWIAL